MKDYAIAFVLFMIFMLMVALIAVERSHSQTTPVPSYTLPETGTITQFGPDGIYTTFYQNHGQTYQSLGPNGFSNQTTIGNQTLRWQPESSNQVQFEHGSLFGPDNFGQGGE